MVRTVVTRSTDRDTDPVIELLGAVARQAIADAQAGYRGRKGMDPQRWLKLAGIMAPDGTIPRLTSGTYHTQGRRTQ